MILETFLETTSRRLPTAMEIIHVCEEIGITFKVKDDGKPAITTFPENRSEGRLLAKLLRREPWRSQVIQAKNLVQEKEPEKPQPEPVPPAAPQNADAPLPWFELRMATGIILDRQHRNPILGSVAWRPIGSKDWTPFENVEPLTDGRPKLYQPEVGDA